MFKSIRNLLDSLDTHHQDEPLSVDQRQLASAALLLEIANADKTLEASETTALHAALKTKFSLSDTELNELITHAASEQEQATSLFQFTQLINQHCSAEEKYNLMVSMWDIAYADGDLDKYEEHLIRRIAELIYVSHSDFIRAKLAVKNAQ